MGWRKIFSQGVGIGKAIFAPLNAKLFDFLFDAIRRFLCFKTDTQAPTKKFSQGVGIEKDVFTSSNHRIFIFSSPDEARKRQNAAQPDQRSGLFLGDWGLPNKRIIANVYMLALLAKDGTVSNGAKMPVDFGGDKFRHHHLGSDLLVEVRYCASSVFVPANTQNGLPA